MDLFIGLYELLHGVQDNPVWEKIYVNTGFWLSIFAILITVLYYYYFNFFFIKFYRKSMWFVFLFINSVINFIIAIFISTYLGEFEITEASVLFFGMINFLYAAIFYFIFSIIIKWWSPNGKNTPF